MKVLFATDGSPNANLAANFLLSLDIDEPLDVVLITVTVEPWIASAESVQPWFPDWLDQENARVAKEHARLQSLFADRCSHVKTLRGRGEPARIILDESKRHEVDLIVMGARGHSLIDRILLGSVSDNVATHAACSVLCVRNDSPEQSVMKNERNVQQVKRILLAYDGLASSREAIGEMLELGWNADTEVDLISIAPIYDYMLGDGLSTAAISNEQQVFEHLENECERMRKQLSATLSNTQCIVERKHHVGDAIVTAATKNNSDLLVIGDAGHGLLHDWVLGSTSKYVLRHAPCSVWISRHHHKFSELPEQNAERKSQAESNQAKRSSAT